MELKTASRKKAKIRLALQGPSGSGKTKCSLLIAYGLAGSWDRIAIIDTENGSADLYADLGPYMVLPLSAPYTPERYIQALGICASAGMQVIIVDSISHEWEGIGGILDIHAAMTGNGFTNWGKVTPRHNAFVQHLLQCDAHIICTIRTKQDYVLTEKNGKQVPEKVGLKGITREGLDYEFTLVFDMDIALKARVSKDRTQLFQGKPEFTPSTETGAIILKWCNQGSGNHLIASAEDVKEAIDTCSTTEELLSLYNAYPGYQQILSTAFTVRKQYLLTNQNSFQNGTANHQ